MTNLLNMEARKGRFTASNIADIMFDKAPTIGFESLCYEKAYERLGIIKPEEKWTSDAIDWGNTHESLAILGFEIRQGVSVKNNKVESIFHPYNDNAGCTPDGLIGDTEGVEVKCPYNPAIFLKLAMADTPEKLKKVNKDYYWQVMSSMLFTGRDKWYFCAYHPEFDVKHGFMGILPIEKNQADFVMIIDRLDAAEKFVQEIIKKVR